MDYLRLSWEDVERACREIAEEIVRRGFESYTPVGLSRGGLVPLRILSDILGKKDVFTLAVSFYRDIDSRKEAPEITVPVQEDIGGRDILLVDDISDTGGSLKAVRRHLLEKGARSIVVTTVVKKPQTAFVPDICPLETSAWVIFPWEVQETVRLIVERFSNVVEAEKELKRAGIKEEEYEKELKRFQV